MAQDSIAPYRIEPKLTPAIWGGDALVRRYGKQGDPAVKLGESWECWDENRADPLEGPPATIAQLRATLGPRLTGPVDPSRIFPILTKIIDARDALSVQVHPGDPYARRVEHQPNGKTEAWYILDAKPGAELVLGWTRDTDAEEYRRRVADGTLGEILRRVPVAAGETYYLPAGTLHAIGGGIVIFEVQQASDLTYRIFDWNRVDASGKGRELHVEKAADVLDFRASSAGALDQLAFRDGDLERRLLIAEERFSLERVDVRGEDGRIDSSGRPCAIMALGAALEVDTQHGALAVAPYETVLVPAAAGPARFRSTSFAAAALVATPAPDLAAVKRRAIACGAAESALDDFFGQFVPTATAV